MREFITSGVLVSAYDISYQLVSPRKVPFTKILFLDSGGYETRVEHDFTESYGRPHRPRRWSRNRYERVLRNWHSRVPTVAVTYDSPKQWLRFRDQMHRARDLKRRYPSFLIEFLIKPETKNQDFIPIERIIRNARRLRDFDIIGLTEKELAESVLDRMASVARLRKAMDSVGIKAPIHIFGSLDTLTTLLYFISGAEIFDGLTWLRFGYHSGRTLYFQNYAVLQQTGGIRQGPDEQLGDMWKSNYYYLERLRTQMVNFLQSGGDFDKFGFNAELLRDAYKQLEGTIDVAR